jgi:hypothetical protein
MAIVCGRLYVCFVHTVCDLLTPGEAGRTCHKEAYWQHVQNCVSILGSVFFVSEILFPLCGYFISLKNQVWRHNSPYVFCEVSLNSRERGVCVCGRCWLFFH